MARFGDLRLALQHLQLQHRSRLDSIARLAQALFAGIDAQLSRLLAPFRRQEAVIELLHVQSNLVLRPVCIVLRDALIRFGHFDSSVDLEDLRDGLSRSGCAQNKIVVPERERIVFPWDRARDRVHAQGSHRNLHVFNIAEVGGVAFIA